MQCEYSTSQNDCFASRRTLEDTIPSLDEISNGIFSADGCMIGVPNKHFEKYAY